MGVDLHRFKHLKVLVIGDLMLDHYIWGTVSRISPEAPVPVVTMARETEMPGGAGNVALNLAALGADVAIAGVVGDDVAAYRLMDKFRSASIYRDAVVFDTHRATTVKTRVIAHNQQIVRVDKEKKEPLSPGVYMSLEHHIGKYIPTVDAIVISDYGKGTVTPELIGYVVSFARQRSIPVIVDPKPENFKYYQRVACITPNLQEAMEGTGTRSIQSDKDLERLGWQIQRDLKAGAVLLTRGEKGMSLFEKGKPVFHIPTFAKEVYDVTGAGDTVISTFTLALATGASMRQAAELANYAAGIVVGKLGTATVSQEELGKAMGVGK